MNSSAAGINQADGFHDKVNIEIFAFLEKINHFDLPRVLSSTNCIPKANGLSCSSTDLQQKMILFCHVL